MFWILYGIIWYFFLATKRFGVTHPPSPTEPFLPSRFIFGQQIAVSIGGEGFDEDLTGVTGSDFDGGAGNGEAAAKTTLEGVTRVGASGWIRQERRQWRSWER